MHHFPAGTGWIEVVWGCMYSGKTEELIRRLNRARYATDKLVLFKPAIDVRYAVDAAVSHSKLRYPSIPVAHAHDILRLVGEAQVVGIDEAQFFSTEIVAVCERLANDGRRVVVAGLDTDFRGVPFDPMPQLAAIAEYVEKTLAVCVVCGAPASRSQRLVEQDARVVLGATDTYEARCRAHWRPDLGGDKQEKLPLSGD